MPITVGGHYKVNVIGMMLGEAANVGLNYFCATGVDTTLTSFLTGFRALWRAQIIPIVSDQYSVITYDVKQFDQIVWKSTASPIEVPPIYPRVSPCIRFSEQADLAGDPVDDVGDITTSEFPSYVAVGAEKVCGPVTDIAMAPLAGEKLMNGSTRFAGAVEADTDDGDGNTLNAAAQTAWQAVLNALRQPTIDGHDMSLEVWSLVKDNAPRANLGAPYMARATVVNYVLKDNLTHQVTRSAGRGS